jgi:TolB-like protein/tetratricopeptide (TPR) repeat protein
MGEVFLARDLALGRPAAIKLLAQPVDPDLQSRLRREAEACARLQHPAIATFYEAGEASGSVFLAMEFVAGKTLRERLERGPLSLPQAISVTACLLEALNHAHAAGVLHRDIKPENIMVTADGLAKLLDFGIARLLGAPESEREARTATALTEAGAVIGTVGYMSPEQLKGQPLDERSDLFSLGAVLYEMLSGNEAFPGESAAEVIAAVLSAAPPPRLDSGAAAGLNAVLDHALARDASRRYPSAAAFLADLRAAASGELVAVLPDTLAVIDFENLSKDPADDWIGSGIVESVSADLLRVPGLSVVARERLIQLRGRLGPAERTTEAVSLGRLLACRWVLSGGYQRVGPRLRVTSRLTDVATGEAVAGEKLDGTLDGIFGMQDELSAAIARKLRPGGAPPSSPPPPPIDAFERHARGRRFFLQLEKGSLDQARLLYEQAVGAEPEYAPALAGLAAVHAMRFTFMTDKSELETAAAYARRAIAADPELAEPRIWLGYALFRQGSPDESVEQEKRAMELDSANVYAPYFAGCALGLFGRHEAALPFFQRALEIEPRHVWAWLGLGWTHLELSRGSEARWCLEKAVELERLQGPHRTAGVSGYLGECLRRLGEPESARARCLEGLEAVERSDNMYRDTFRGHCLCALGRAAVDLRDDATAAVAFHQAVTHLRGRPRTLGGGYLLIQALSGLARAGGEPAPLEEALALWRARDGHDFSFMWSCTPEVTLLEISRAAASLGRREEAAAFLAQARAAGLREPSTAAGR